MGEEAGKRKVCILFGFLEIEFERALAMGQSFVSSFLELIDPHARRVFAKTNSRSA
jgi:hypothetical protein